MDWIKKNPEKFALLLLSLALLAVAGFLAYTEQKFLQSFDKLKEKPVENSTMPPLETVALTTAGKDVEKPATWEYDSNNHEGILFASAPYKWQKVDNVSTGTLVPFGTGTSYPPVPDSWILSHHLDLLDSNVINEDPDDDGYTTVEEYLAGTDPTDKTSHPPYITKLFLEKYVQIPFLLKFMDEPDANSYQIQVISPGGRETTQILSIGQTVEGTRYKIVSFKAKSVPDPTIGGEKDVSELTVQNTETGKQVVLVKGVQANDPDSYALFKYFWPKPPVELQPKLDGTFALPPQTDVAYKVIDIKEDHATIEDVKTTKQFTIPKLKADEKYHAPDGKLYNMSTGKEID